MTTNTVRLSTLFLSLKQNTAPDQTIGSIADTVALHSIGCLLAVLAALNLFPLPPGTSAVTGIPIVLIAVQLIFLRKSMWLPKFIRTKPIDVAKMESVFDHFIKWARWMEQYVRPRFWPFSSILGERVVGTICLVLGTMVVLPIPLGNFLPALSATILGIALSERDGIWLVVGLTSALISLTWIAILISGATYSIGLLS